MIHPLEIYSAELDGHPASEADARRLSRWIAEDPAHAQAVVDLSLIHGLVDEHLSVSRLLDQLASSRDPAVQRAIETALVDAEAAWPSAAPSRPAAARSQAVGRVAWLAVAVVLLVGMGLFAFRLGEDLEVAEEAAPPPALLRDEHALPQVDADARRVVATVTAALDARWSRAGDAQGSVRRGTPLRKGDEIALHEGIVQFANSQGSVLVVEAPAAFTLPDDNRVVLTQGRLAARVTEQKGNFRVETPTAVVVDLGTEFGVGVDADGETAVSVYEGAIELGARDGERPTARHKRIVEAGRTGYVDRQGQLSYAVALLPHERDFIRPDEVALRAQASKGSPEAQQVARFYRLQRVEGLLAYQGFDLPSGGHAYCLGLAEPPLRGAPPLSLAAVKHARQVADSGALRVRAGGGVFLDFDTSTTSPFARLGLLDHRENIGRSGGELWLCWSARGTDAPPAGLGVSLMFGDERPTQEPLFVGSRSRSKPPVLVANIGSRSIVQPLPSPSASSESGFVRYWVVHLLLAERADVATVWCVSDLGDVDPTQPHAELPNANIAFDRLHFNSSDSARDVLVDDVIVADRLGAIREVHELVGNNE